MDLDASYKLGENNMLEFRGSFAKEQLRMDGNEWLHPSVSTFYSIKMESKYDQKITNLQLQDTITMDEDLWLTLILRAHKVQADGIDLTQHNNSGTISPSPYSEGFATDDQRWNYSWGVALKNVIPENWTIKATGGTFIRYPNFYELFGDGVYIRPALFYEDEIPIPKPERGEQWDFTVDWVGNLPFLSLPTTISASYFYRRTENMIGLFQTPHYVYYGNYGLTRATGVEMEAGLKSAYVDLNFSATWLETKVVDVAKTGLGRPSMWFSEGHEILNSPQWETFSRAEFHLPWVEWVTVFAEHHYTDKVPIAYRTQTHDRYEEELETVNLGVKVKIFGDMLITAGINDVFNKAVEQGYYETNPMVYGANKPTTLFFPKEGRTHYLSIQYTF
jgi:outer membrane receptor protein involved in Fe transport